MTITVENECGAEFAFDYEAAIVRAVQAVIREEVFPYEAEVNVMLVSLVEIQRINTEFRDLDQGTDVLSFPLLSFSEAGNFNNIEKDGTDFNRDTNEVLLGDIILCAERVSEQARAYGHSELRELSFLIVHSMLHLFGYDHMQRPEAEAMEEKQHKILNKMGITR